MDNFGIKISNNKISIDTGANFTWTGSHAFVRPVSFCADQKISTDSLFNARLSAGDMLFGNINGFSLLKIGPIGSVLFSSGSSPTWGYVNLESHVTGVLPLHLGGTGLSSAPEKGLFVSDGHKILSLPLGESGTFLCVEHGQLMWKRINLNIDQNDDSYIEPLSQINNDNSEKENQFVAQWNDSGELIEGLVPSKHILGTINTTAGGTGISKFAVGDILYASSENKLSKLSTKGKENCFLQVSNGVPVWKKIPELDKLAKKSYSFEFGDNGLIYVDGKKRKSIVLHGEDITGKSSGINGILNLESGGTGRDLSSFTAGSLVILNDKSSMIGLDQGNNGLVLVSKGVGNPPAWEPSVMRVEANEGILCFEKDGLVRLEVDSTEKFNPVWQGQHVFDNTVGFSKPPIMAKGLSIAENNDYENHASGDLWRQNDHLYYRSGAKTICISQPENDSKLLRTSHYIRIAFGDSIDNGEIQKNRTLMPHTLDKIISGAQWRIARIDVLCEQCPTQDSGALIDVVLENGSSVLVSPITIEKDSRRGFSVEFKQAVLSDDETLRLVIKNSGEANFWSAWVLIEEFC